LAADPNRKAADAESQLVQHLTLRWLLLLIRSRSWRRRLCVQPRANRLGLGAIIFGNIDPANAAKMVQRIQQQ
jgi:hypothetical protein